MNFHPFLRFIKLDDQSPFCFEQLGQFTAAHHEKKLIFVPGQVTHQLADIFSRIGVQHFGLGAMTKTENDEVFRDDCHGNLRRFGNLFRSLTFRCTGFLFRTGFLGRYLGFLSLFRFGSFRFLLIG